MDDERFRACFEAGLIEPASFRHADHIRLAWVYLRAFGYEEAEGRMREAIRGLAARAGVPGKYHETLTIAWMRLVAAAIALSPRASTFDAFSRAHGWLLDKGAIGDYYGAQRLASAQARAGWVDPDLRELPPVPRRPAAAA